MEQPCYKCGQAVEQGIAFCPQCSAPQIRVVMEEPAAPPVLAVPTSRDPASLPPSQTVPLLALPMQWSQALKPCALAALVAFFLMTLGLNPFVAMLSAGFLAVVFFRQSRREMVMKAASGASLGALGGLLWFAMSSMLEALAIIVLHQGPALRVELIKKIQQAASKTSDPTALAMFERFRTPAGLELLMLAGIVFAFLVSIVLGGLGGALGGALLGRRDKT